MSRDVLLVDPDEGLLDAVASALSSEETTVTTETDPRAALSALESADCVVSGHHPPALDGIGLLDRVRRRKPEVPFVLYPAAGSETLAGRAVSAGVTEYVPREEGIRTLVERVQGVVAAGSIAVAGNRGAGGATSPIEGGVDGGPGETATAGSGEEATGTPGAGVTSEEAATDDPDVRPSQPGGEVPEGVETPDEVPFDLKERAMDEAPVGITISDPDLPDNQLVYVNDAFERMTGYTREDALGTNCRFLQGEETDEEPVRRMAEAVDAEQPVSVELVNYRKDGEMFWNKVDVAPLRNGDGEVTNYVGFQTDVTARKRAEVAVERYAERLDRERAALDRILDRVNGLVRDATETLVGATTREEIDRRISELVARTPPYVGAWTGDLDMARDAIRPVAAAGLDLPDDPDPIPMDGEGPVARAVETGDLQRVDGDLEGDAPDGTDAEPAAVVPLYYRDTCYGVLVVYAEDAAAVDEREQAVLAALGRMIATAINATETKAILAAEDVVALTFDVSDSDLFFVGLPAGLDCSMELAGSITGDDGNMLLFFTVEGADAETVVSAAERRPDVERATTITENEDDVLVEFATAEPSILTELAEYGAEVRAIHSADGRARLEIEVAHEPTARTVVDVLTERYDGTDLMAFRERERAPTTRGDFVADLRDRLTDRQLTAIQKAYVSGYYEWPRTTSGDELAESMGITRSTFHQHLRAAQSKLVAALFPNNDPTG